MPPNFGPTVVIDGPAPSPPALTLMGSARLVLTSDDRWINGVGVWPYPRDLPDVFDPCQPSSSAGHSKAAGTPVTPETWGAYNVLEAISCTTRSIGKPEEWMRRVQVALEAYEHWAVEREFWTGALKPDNPRIAQATGTNGGTTVQLNASAATSIKNGIALLEQAIADAGGNGVIHMRPGVFSQMTYEGPREVFVDRGVARTQLGTVVVPGVGYTGSAPDGTPPATTVEWLYATGPVEVRRSEIVPLPASMTEATDRQQNTTTFRAERYVLVDFDQRIHAAVKVDRSFTNFTS